MQETNAEWKYSVSWYLTCCSQVEMY